ncbi:hypothetical protein HJC23_001993 [Cyclotella cryptica]|uniref:Crinkler family protein n=1 Tax=Cyclotella cryptica TaxID=29204 RepID=A0ABD3NVL6_9STRA|eukprot:CCRYP_019554-RA/>CCRYP_019554-RA protein AED:0.09 eAED:0.09 QI:0/-1/0/1/-1/1/1/0/579
MLSSDQQQSSASCLPPLPRLIWFLLVDSETGEPYKNCTASSIEQSLLTFPVVAQFKKLVHRKISCILTGVAPCQLVVYKNQAAFDRRNNADDEGKEQPLKASRSLDDLGESEEEALIIVVPPPIQPLYQQYTQTQAFHPCQIPFFNSILTATERDGRISFGQEEIPSTHLNTLYIRECYRTIASRILPVKGIHKAIITGTPGIGKSLFLIYLLWRLVKEGKRVLFIYDSINIYFDGNGGVFSWDITRWPWYEHLFWNDTLWCLFNAKSKTESDLGRFPVGLFTFIVSTTPRDEMVNDFKKPHPVPQVFYMPTWTEAELEKIAPLFPAVKNEWRGRLTILGGIPRDVLEITTQTPTSILEAACYKCSLEDCLKNISITSRITEKAAVHSLVHMSSIPPFTESSLCCASPTALDIIVRRKAKEARHKYSELLGKSHPIAAALFRYIFEPYAVELLERGGTFTCRRLVDGNNRFSGIETTLDIPPSKKIVVDKVLPNLTLNQLYVPKTKTCAAIDAWIPGVGAFQVTAGEEFGINEGAIDDLAKLGGDNRLYWLLFPCYFNKFTKQSPHSIEQYAVRIPSPD